MRIISGLLKGKKLIYPNNKVTRPLRDMVKEAVFNLIDHANYIKIKISNSNVLDLFSGSGSFGVECLSRGAQLVTFVENNNYTIKILEKNLSIISQKDKNKVELIKENCFKYLDNNVLKKYDLIFMDPPFKETKVNQLIDSIKSKEILSFDGIIVLHRHKKDKMQFNKNIKILDERIYGISKITIAY